jgi:hypothetical protein
MNTRTDENHWLRLLESRKLVVQLGRFVLEHKTTKMCLYFSALGCLYLSGKRASLRYDSDVLVLKSCEDIVSKLINRNYGEYVKVSL